MHELSITQNILSIALEKAEDARAKRVTRVNLTFGGLSGIVDDCPAIFSPRKTEPVAGHECYVDSIEVE